MEYRRPVAMDNEQNKRAKEKQRERPSFFLSHQHLTAEGGSPMALLSREKNGGRIFPRSLFL